MKLPFTRTRTSKNYVPRLPKSVNTSQSVYSYGSSRKEPARQNNRGENQKQKTNILAKRWLKYFFALAVLVSLSYLLFLSPNAELELEGQSVVDRAQGIYQIEVNKYLKQSYTNYTKLTFNSDKAAREISTKFPEASHVSITLPLFNRQPKIIIKFAEPVIVFRSFGDDNYLVDEQGRALIRQSNASKSLNIDNLLIVNDTSDQKIELGNSLLTEQQVNFIQQTAGQARQKKVDLQYINLTGGTSQLEVKYSDVSYIIKYSYLADARQSSGAYFAIREQLIRDNKTPKHYIDLRIPDRAYIK